MIPTILALHFENSDGDLALIVPIAIVAIVYFYAHRRNEMAHETLRRMIDKGQSVTPETIAALKLKTVHATGTTERSRRDHRTAVILIGIGIGVLLLGGKPGWIVLFLGLAFLVLSRTDRLKEPELPAPLPQQPAQSSPQPPSQLNPTDQPPQ
jgi:hypothetical protein